jgi:hypothetical protein
MSTSNTKPSSSSTSDLTLVKKGKFYFIYGDSNNWILEDKTKRGLEVKEKTNDPENKNVLSEKGMIYDMDGRGHKVSIRWYYPKNEYSLQKIEQVAQIMEKRYIEIREITCPSD